MRPSSRLGDPEMSMCENLQLRIDMNGDSAYTITDLWLQIKGVYLLPANAIVEASLPSSGLSRFLELDCWSAHGIVGAILSGFLWWVALVIVGGLLVGIAKTTK